MGFKLLLESMIYNSTQAWLQDFNLGGIETPRAKNGDEVLGEGAAIPSHQLEGLGERCKLSLSNRGRPNGFTILSTQDAVS